MEAIPRHIVSKIPFVKHILQSFIPGPIFRDGQCTTKSPRGHRWCSQIRLIQEEFIYKKTNYKGAGGC